MSYIGIRIRIRLLFLFSSPFICFCRYLRRNGLRRYDIHMVHTFLSFTCTVIIRRNELVQYIRRRILPFVDIGGFVISINIIISFRINIRRRHDRR